MWVFDGEKWIEEGTSPQPDQSQKPLESGKWQEFYPELQVLEVPRTEQRREIHVPVLIP